MGRQFTLFTDHKPLVRLLDIKQATSSTGAARIQWSLYFGNFDYIIEYRKCSLNSNADALLRLPLPTTESTFEEVDHVKLLHVQQIQANPIDSKQCRLATINDPILARVLEFIQHGWPVQCPSDELLAYYSRSSELTSEDHIILWGLRVVIPQKLQNPVLSLLHDTHIGIVRMNGLARSRFWWPGIDADIERICNECSTCSQNAKNQSKNPLSVRDFPSGPWQRIHIDYAGFFYGSMWLVWIDAYSKYAGVERVKSANSINTVRKLEELFSFFGNQEQIFSDNGTTFTAMEFSEFCTSNGIRHICSTPYYPATNGKAERFVQVFKIALRSGSQADLDTELEVFRFLQRYRTTPHSSTGRTPSNLLFGRTIRSTLDFLKPQIERKVLAQQLRYKQNFDRNTRLREFSEGQDVFACMYLGHKKSLGGIITRQTGNVSYDVQVGDKIHSRHASQLLPNRGGHQDYFDNQCEELCESAIDSKPKVSPTENALQKPQETATSLQPPSASAKDSETPIALQAMKDVTPQKKIELPQVKAPAKPVEATRSLRDRGKLAPRVKFNDEYSGLGSNRTNVNDVMLTQTVN